MRAYQKEAISSASPVLSLARVREYRKPCTTSLRNSFKRIERLPSPFPVLSTLLCPRVSGCSPPVAVVFTTSTDLSFILLNSHFHRLTKSSDPTVPIRSFRLSLMQVRADPYLEITAIPGFRATSPMEHLDGILADIFDEYGRCAPR